MGFKRREAELLLVQCHRRCCICHRFCGTKIELDHIEPHAESHDDSIENAIAVCFECHAEIHSYNPRHPRGRRFSTLELKAHKTQWLDLCCKQPEMLTDRGRGGDVGPLQAIVDELAFNSAVAASLDDMNRGALFESTQFLRAIEQGLIAVLKDDLREAIIRAYVVMSRANRWVIAETQQDVRMQGQGTNAARARAALSEAKTLVDAAYDLLVGFLGHSAADDNQ